LIVQNVSGTTNPVLPMALKERKVSDAAVVEGERQERGGSRR
jgi:hypothetical protein